MKKLYYIPLIFIIFILGVTLKIYFTFDVEKVEETFESRYSQMVLDETDKILGVYLNKDEQWHLKSEEKIPEKLKEAVLNFEDRKFYSHSGVDFKAILRAIRDNIFSRQRTGASTIDMQVVKILNPKKRNYFNKYIEIVQALKLDRYLNKDEILRIYLNNASYGGNIVGYKTASLLYFQKEPNELTWGEATLLAVLPNSPGLIHVEKNRDRLVKKRNLLLKKLKARKIISELQYNLSIKEPIPKQRYFFKSVAPHFTRRVTTESSEKIIKTTIDRELQIKIEKVVKDYSEYLRSEGIPNIAVMVVNNKNYEVKAYVGSQEFFDEKSNGQVDGVIALRSPGSLLKPFLFALAIDDGLIAPQSKVPDVPLYFSNFNPQNANKKYYGMIEIREALIKSLNIPFVNLLREYGEERFFYFLKQVLNFKDSDVSRYGLSLILGTKELKLEDIAKLYTGLGNYGNFKELKYIKSQPSTEGEQLLSKGSAYLTLDTIKELQRPGLERMYIEKNPISWKTGTSYGRKDGWAAGVTPEWTVVVWTGDFTGKGNINLTGVKTSGKLLFNIFNILSCKEKEFILPKDNILKIKVDKETGYRLKYDIPFKDIYYPSEAKTLKTSPYYKKIFVTEDGREVDSRDSEFVNSREEIVLNYPIEVINYLIKENRDISTLYSNKIKKKSVKFIYPVKNLKIILPKDFDGEKDIIIKIANLKKQNIYWYINGEYIGEGRESERKLNLKAGKYQVTIVSSDGEIEKVDFEIEKTR